MLLILNKLWLIARLSPNVQKLLGNFVFKIIFKYSLFIDSISIAFETGQTRCNYGEISAFKVSHFNAHFPITFIHPDVK